MKKPKYEKNETYRMATMLGELVSPEPVQQLFRPRLAEGTIEQFQRDVPLLADKQSQADDARLEKESLTEAQNTQAVRCAELVVAVRKTIRNHNPGNKALLKRYGVGEPVKTGSIASVRSALETVVNALEADPQSARQSGLLPEDVTRIEAELASLTSTDVSQEGKKLSALNAIAERNAAQLRVEDAMAKIQGVAGIVYIDNPEMLARFQSCMPASRKASRASKKASSEPGQE